MKQIPQAQIKQIVTDYVFGSEHPDLVVYRRDFGSKFDMDRWIKSIEHRCQLGSFHGKHILEVGCGFGWDAVGLSLIGNNKVVATDILPSMIQGTNECLASARAAGHCLNVEAMQGDICALELEDQGFDGIYSSEAIEHVHDLAAMFKRCYALLKSGGRMLIVNDANRYNTKFREATFEMWKERDESWEHAAWLKAEIRPVEHADAKPYAAMREAIIAEVDDATIDSASRAQLVAATAGLKRSEIVAATEQFKRNGTMPVRPEFSWCRNPETGEYAERLLDPFELREMIRAAGFRNVRLRHAFTRFPFRLLNSISFRPVNTLLFDRRGIFILVADKA